MNKNTEPLIGKTIKSIEKGTINCWSIHFTDGTAISVWADVDGIGIPEIFLDDVVIWKKPWQFHKSLYTSTMSKFKIGDEVIYTENKIIGENVKMRGRIIREFKEIGCSFYMVSFEGCSFACAESELVTAADWAWQSTKYHYHLHMGYNTTYSLKFDTSKSKTKKREIFNEIQLRRAAGMDYLYGIELDGYGEACKWYDHEEEMAEFSKIYPDVVFELSGEGEESGDIWKKYFKNGQKQICMAEIVYPPYDETKLRGPTK